MSEAELREGLKAAVGDEPPLRFDPEELIRRGRRERKRRRALVAVAAVTLAATGTVLSLPGLLAPRPVVEVAVGPVLTTEPSAAVLTTVTPATPPTPVDTKLLAYYLEGRFGAVVPDVKVVGAEFTDASGMGSRTQYLAGYLVFIDAEGPTGASVEISTPPRLFTRDEFCRDAGCAAPRRLADGSTVEFTTDSAGRDGTVVHSAAHFRTDGSAVRISCYNYDPAQGPTPTRDTVSLTDDELVALATDPGLTAG
ncbi:hypothetical protein [Saccharothrix syringae]|uniref:Uncharacterized protein n=1 Tax=Saccharothrix syringae TaxID=103733 RepID=A0A5Q0HBU1_SACSY|nr:hypothetical protein [Saccharothrix syringae]QFZ23737.1 hypothetical protein EKG83_45490 [Saccharothrix syringae]